ncbi:MAG: lipoprotein LpqH [Mycobacterium sp.]|nr:lipoprotein LpqH [Mycobacterium sp.]
MIPATAGCSSEPQQAPLKQGELVSGTAHITVNDNDLGQFHAVSCTAAGPFTTITTGTDESGSTVVVSNESGLTAKSVSIHDLGGFTGSYTEGLAGNAKVTLEDATYKITGDADGFTTDKPSFRTTGTFTINVAC